MSFKHIFPLVSVPFSIIDRVERVAVDLPVETRLESELNLHQFEIFLKDHEVSTGISMPKNYIEEQKICIGDLNHDKRRKPRFFDLPGSENPLAYTDSYKLRSRSLLFHRENDFSKPGHSMPKPTEKRLKRCLSLNNLNGGNSDRKVVRQI